MSKTPLCANLLAHKDGWMQSKLQELGLPESFCFAPYVNLDLDQSGKFLACFRSKQNMGEWKHAEVTDEFNNANMQQLRDDLWNGNTCDNCSQCHRREAQGVTSTRQDINQYFLQDIVDAEYLPVLVEKIKQNHLHSDVDNIHMIEIRPHAICNLACAHCDENSSSRWLSLKRNSVPDEFKTHLVDDPGLVTKLLASTTRLRTLHFTGGEPLVDKHHLDWLAQVPDPAKIQLRYHSNLQHTLYERFFDAWNQFQSVKIFNSLDTSERFYHYFRFGADWQTVHSNLLAIRARVPNSEIKGTITVNMLTMLDWIGIVKYLVVNQIDMHVAFVDPPHPISCVYLPEQLKQTAHKQLTDSLLIVDQYTQPGMRRRAAKQIQRVQQFLDTEYQSDNMHPDSVEYMKYLDATYGMSIVELAPELTEWIK